MSENKTNRDGFTFFNEEWNQPFLEDRIDVIDQRNKKTNNSVED